MLKLASKAILFNTKPINIQIEKTNKSESTTILSILCVYKCFSWIFLSGGANLQE